ncbi:hypothetical protein [Halobellus sp. GM3]|uniref:hypothetical protein n=1 Tax=Halobellus sp. GM3 TaxID=3458410 RepID=UPI00403DA7D2
MPLHQRVRDRFRPWYLLDVAAFLVGAVGSLRRAASGLEEQAATTTHTSVVAVAAGLLAVVVLRFTVGNLWGYAVEYVNAGGQWSDLPFLLPVGSGLAAAALAYAVTSNFGAAAWGGFWAFVVAAGVVAIAVSFAAGYREPGA